MARPLLSTFAALTGVAGLSLALLLSTAKAAQTSATPMPPPNSCGSPVAAWGPGIVDDVQVALIQFATSKLPDSSGTPVTQASPEAGTQATHFAEIEILNAGETVVTVVAHDITLVLCDGTVLLPVADETYPSLPDGQFPTGAVQSGWIAFAVPSDGVPARLIVPVSRPGSAGGRVEFPLVDLTATVAAGVTPGSGDANGADVVGADAFGGDGADGADATAENGG